GVTDLRPPREAGLHAVAIRVIRNLFFKLRHKLRSFRTGPDESHVATQNVQQLRQFINSRLADERAYAGHPGIPNLRPLRPARLGVLPHAAEFRELEYLPLE